MKEWKCVLVGHHDNVGKVIEEWEKMGWHSARYAGFRDKLRDYFSPAQA